MSVLRNLEQRIENLVEGVFSRAFSSQVQPVERVDNGGCDDESCVPLVVRGHDVPRRVPGGRVANHVVVSGLVVLPKPALLDVSH